MKKKKTATQKVLFSNYYLNGYNLRQTYTFKNQPSFNYIIFIEQNHSSKLLFKLSWLM